MIAKHVLTLVTSDNLDDNGTLGWLIEFGMVSGLGRVCLLGNVNACGLSV